MRFLVLWVLLVLSSCTSHEVRPELDASIDYQKDVLMKVSRWQDNSWGPYRTIKGMGIIKKAEGYKIRVYPPGKADMITVLSCHREWKTPNPDRKGGWFKQKYYEFEIWPTEEHEIEQTCPFSVGVYEKNAGRHAWGLLVIESERAKLGATSKCNGRTEVFNGTSVCQAKKGLIESIHFDRKVLATEVEGCKIDSPADGRNWIYRMPEGECAIYFVDYENADIFHKAVFYGYDVIPIRGVE